MAPPATGIERHGVVIGQARTLHPNQLETHLAGHRNLNKDRPSTWGHSYPGREPLPFRTFNIHSLTTTSTTHR